MQDLLLESVAGLVNLTARRIAKEDERDLEQARIGIEAVRAVVDLLEPEPGKAVKEALSELQVLYAREAGGGPPASDDVAAEPGESAPPPKPQGEVPPTGRRAEPPPRLWTPPGTG